jgi:hypothetical protein
MSNLTDSDDAVMILASLQERASRRPPGKGLTRARFTRLTLKRLCDRETITQPWIDRVNEFLLKAGWVLIDAGTTYGAVKVSVVENWPRATSKNVMADLAKLKQGKFDIKKREQLMSKDTWETTTHLRPKTKK